jgi:PadR family transcriptional regulator PadR
LTASTSPTAAAIVTIQSMATRQGRGSLARVRWSIDCLGIEYRGMGRESFSGHLELLLLAALQAEPRHGYGVIEHLRRTSGGRFDYPEGTVYPALHRLEAGGLLRSRWKEVEGRRRRVYELTRRGETALAGRRREWEQFALGISAVVEQA